MIVTTEVVCRHQVIPLRIVNSGNAALADRLRMMTGVFSNGLESPTSYVSRLVKNTSFRMAMGNFH